jgi:LPS-assembly protein
MLNFCSKHPVNRELSRRRNLTTGLVGLALFLATGSSHAARGSERSIAFIEEALCSRDMIDIPAAVLAAHGADTATQEIVLESDEIESPDSNTLILTGNAQVIQGPQAIFGQTIVYDKSSYSLNAENDVSLITPDGDRLNMARLVLEMETLIGDADTVDFQLAKRANKRKRGKRGISAGGLGFGGALEGFGGGSLLSSKSSDDNASTEESMPSDAESATEDAASTEDASVADGKAKKKKSKGGPKIGIEAIHAEMRGEAQRVFFEGHDRQRLKKVKITSCRQGQNAVFLNASEIVLDHATGVGIGTNMTVRFFGVPIWYFPKASFPINDERKTGFLFPSVGSSERSGSVVEIPYYINIAPDKDASLTLKYMSDRGVQLRGEYRYLSENYDGIFQGEFLPDDEIYGDDRSAWSYDHTHRFATKWQGDIKVQEVSDEDYTDDLRNNIDISSSSFLRQQAKLRYRGPIVRFDARVQDYTKVDSSVDENRQPYAFLPALSLSAKTPRSFAGGKLEVGLSSAITEFDHPGDRITGNRTIVTPYVMAPLQTVYGYLKPKLSVVNNSYSLDNTEAGAETSPSFSVPIFSVDAGIAFERDTNWGGKPHYQTLEPRAFYVYAPEEDQDDAPDIDTGGGDSNNIGNFYRENRFFGGDRVGDANRLTLGLKTRIIDSESGDQRLQAQIGQMFHFDDREVQLGDDEVETEDKSDLIGDIRGNVTAHWEIGGSFRYSHEEGETESVRLDTTYQKDARRRLSMNYSWNKDSSEQVNVEAYWPLATKWQLLYKNRYDIEEGESRSSSFAIGYDACCWAARLSTEERTRRNSENERQVYLTIELKNLGKVSSSY